MYDFPIRPMFVLSIGAIVRATIAVLCLWLYTNVSLVIL